MTDRLEILVGDKLKLLEKKKVVLLGLGGVGSMCFNSLIRSNIKNITIVDFDCVDITNLNRQLYTKKDIGKYKTDVMREYASSIDEYNIECISEKVTAENIDRIIENADYVIDAIDDVKVKIELVKICSRDKIKLISCMGTGNRMDPSKVSITRLKDTYNDPLSRKMRQSLKNSKTKVVFSSEVPLDRDSIGSNALVPATAGIMLASFVVGDIVGKL